MGDVSQSAASDFEMMLARAFDDAWARFLSAEGEVADTADHRGALAARIIVVARTGGTDEEHIGAAALIYMRALLAAKRLARPNSSGTARAPAASAVLDQDGIAAVAAAYDLCLEDLPEGISATARSALLQTIIANAGTGERDSRRLSLVALEALRLRH